MRQLHQARRLIFRVFFVVSLLLLAIHLSKRHRVPYHPANFSEKRVKVDPSMENKMGYSLEKLPDRFQILRDWNERKGKSIEEWIETRSKKDFMERLCFVVIVAQPLDDSTLQYIRSFVGGLHKLRVEDGRVPNINIITLEEPPIVWREEMSIWQRVKVQTIQTIIGIALPTIDMLEMVKTKLFNHFTLKFGNLILVNYPFLFDPAFATYQKAEITQDPTEIRKATENSRRYLEALWKSIQVNSHLQVKDENGDLAVETFTADMKAGKPRLYSAKDFGILRYKRDSPSKLSCYLDVSDMAINSMAVFARPSYETKPNGKYKALSNLPGIKRLAIGMPTTSKGLKPGEDPVFFRATIGTMLETVLDLEWERFTIDVWIGYDHGDLLFEDPNEMAMMIERLQEMIGDRPLVIKFVRLPAVKRIGMLWSMLFAIAMRNGADYFYQVNDDLRMVTRGWLTQFTRTLDANSGFGVAGPCDNQVGFGCKLLTQAMVSRSHHTIFPTFYPLPLRDWKTDVWLSRVYGPKHTHCWPEIVANNGASGTRYEHCMAANWRIYLDEGRDRIDKFKTGIFT